MAIRFVIYGLLGWCMEIVWTAVTMTLKGEQQGWRLEGKSYLWMFPIYGLAAPLFEPLHDLLRPRPWLLRGSLYVLGFWTVEYGMGWLLRRLTGVCPWDYSRARWHVHGLIRLDYAPAWFLVGMGLERLHDLLVRLTPAIQQALR